MSHKFFGVRVAAGLLGAALASTSGVSGAGIAARLAAPFGGFTDISAGLTGVVGSSVAWGDYDNDGDLDILLTGVTTTSEGVSRVYRNDGAGVFTDISAGLPGVASSSVAWGDYDNDGDLDILLTGQTITSEIVSRLYRNEGAGVFTDIGAGLPGVVTGSVAWGDYDNDGDLDILLTGQTGSGVTSRVYRNDGAGVFTDSGVALAGVEISSVAWGDYDNDGDLDILLTGQTDSEGISRLYRNDGAGVFTDTGAALPGVRLSSVAWGDYDNDGDLDILLTGETDSQRISRVYENNGGSFSDIGASLEGVAASSVAWGDYDNDGDLDILLTGHTGLEFFSRVYRNDGAGGFEISAALPGVAQGSVAWGDYDNDGDLDILLTGSTGSELLSAVYRNDNGVSNTPPNAPSGLSTQIAGDQVTVSWIASTDVETPAAGLSYNLRIGTTPGGSEISSGMANFAKGYRRVVQLGNAQKRTSWTVRVPGPLRSWRYYCSAQAIDAAFAGSPFSAEVVTDGAAPPVPTRFALHANVPNPFNPETAISFEVPVAGRVELAVFDATGRRVRSLVDEKRAAGTYTAVWDGTSDRGSRVASGVYLCRMNSGSFSATRPITLVK